MTETSERGVAWLPYPPENGPPARPQFIGQDTTPWCLHAEAERRWLLDAVEWLVQRLARMGEPK